MYPLSRKISAKWLFVLGIAIGIGLMSFALQVLVIDATDYHCLLDAQKCLEISVDCKFDCGVKQIDPNALRWLLFASLPVFLIALILGIMNKDAKRG